MPRIRPARGNRPAPPPSASAPAKAWGPPQRLSPRFGPVVAVLGSCLALVIGLVLGLNAGGPKAAEAPDSCLTALSRSDSIQAAAGDALIAAGEVIAARDEGAGSAYIADRASTLALAQDRLDDALPAYRIAAAECRAD